MDSNKSTLLPSFLTYEPKTFEYSLFQLNLYLNGFGEQHKPYKIDYNTVLMSYHMCKSKDLDKFSQDHAISYFLLNPTHDSAEAREALYIEIREFLAGN